MHHPKQCIIAIFIIILILLDLNQVIQLVNFLRLIHACTSYHME